MKQYKDSDWLKYQIDVLHKTFNEIAVECGVTKPAVMHYANKFAIHSSNPPHARKGRFLGEKSPLWKGGKRQYVYNWYAVSETYKHAAFYTCSNCGKTPENTIDIHVHHIDGNKMNNDPRNIIVLCRSCHALIHRASAP